MGRFFSPLLFLVVGVGVGVYNAGHDDRAVVFPFLGSIFPSLAGDPKGQGQLTAALILGLGVLLGVAALLRRPPPDQD